MSTSTYGYEVLPDGAAKQGWGVHRFPGAPDDRYAYYAVIRVGQPENPRHTRYGIHVRGRVVAVPLHRVPDWEADGAAAHPFHPHLLPRFGAHLLWDRAYRDDIKWECEWARREMAAAVQEHRVDHREVQPARGREAAER